MLNHWDNMDGSIERGYSGTSFSLKIDQVLVTQAHRTIPDHRSGASTPW